MFHRILEFLFGLDKGFLDREGAAGVTFNPDWPGGAAWMTVWSIVLLAALALTVWYVVRQVRLHRHVGLAIGAGWLVALVVAATLLYYQSGTRRWTAIWNFSLGLGGLSLVAYVYSREGRSTAARLTLATLRLLLLAFVLLLLNRPVLTLSSSRTEPSVLAILLDDSVSMRVRDGGAGTAPGPGGAAEPRSRIEAVADLLAGSDQALLKDLSRKHILKFYRFDSSSHPLATVAGKGQGEKELPASESKALHPGETDPFAPAVEALQKMQPEGQTTQVVASIRAALDDLQGQRVAGVVLLTDGRDTPVEPLAEAINGLKNYGVRLYPIPVGSDQAPRNIEIEPPDVQDSAFVGDVVNVKVKVRAAGFGPGHEIRLVLKDKRTGVLLKGPEGQPVEQVVRVENDKPQEVELPFKADEKGKLDVTVEAVKEAGETDDSDNVRTAQVDVIDARINVFYVDGYPRWEYRYIKNDLINDATGSVNISCFLQSADTTFAQEGTSVPGLRYFPYKAFPSTMEQLQEADVVVFGDVDPQQISDAQLQLVSDFVSKKFGGFAMIAGPRSSPQKYRNTPIEDLLPVNIKGVAGGYPADNINKGFRPVLTPAGEASSLFRFFPEKARNKKYLEDELQGLFWYCRGVAVKPGVGQVFAEHPSDNNTPDGRRAPLVVVGQFGKGRTLFSAVDDTWRWRYYTGEEIFHRYWVQTFRYLARAKKLGTHNVFRSLRPAYQQGETVKLSLTVLDQSLLPQLGEQVAADVVNEQGQVVRRENLLKQEGQNDLFVATFVADKVGKFSAKLPPLSGDQAGEELPYEVILPRQELVQPQADRPFLARLAGEAGLGAGATGGSQVVDIADARAKLAGLIPSAAVVRPLVTSQPLWDAPLALAIFVLLITIEWVLRKVYGML